LVEITFFKEVCVRVAENELVTTLRKEWNTFISKTFLKHSFVNKL